MAEGWRAQVQELAALLCASPPAVALTGAGISVPSGIPDFRSPGTGLWEKVNPFEVAHIEAFHRDPQRFWRFYSERFAVLADKEPNGAHLALAELERRGLLKAVITQNIDRLHAKAGSREVIEVHGSIESCSCLRCGAREPLETVLEAVATAADGVPRCQSCAAPLKPDVVLFGELLPAAAFGRAEALCAGAAVLLCIGTSLEVHPVAGLPTLTAAAGGKVAIITRGSTPLDDLASVRIDADVEEALTALLAEVETAGC